VDEARFVLYIVVNADTGWILFIIHASFFAQLQIHFTIKLGSSKVMETLLTVLKGAYTWANSSGNKVRAT